MKKLHYDFGNDDVSMPFELEIETEKIEEAIIDIMAREYGKDNHNAIEKIIAKMYDDGLMRDVDELMEIYELDLLDYFEDIAREQYRD